MCLLSTLRPGTTPAHIWIAIGSQLTMLHCLNLWAATIANRASRRINFVTAASRIQSCLRASQWKKNVKHAEP